MKYSLHRINASLQTMQTIQNALACVACTKVDITNNFVNDSCHSGSLCQQCSNSCTRCCKKQKKIHPEIAQNLANLTIRCKNFNEGCSVCAPYEGIEEHELTCIYGKAKGWNFRSLLPQAMYFGPADYVQNQPMNEPSQLSCPSQFHDNYLYSSN